MDKHAPFEVTVLLIDEVRKRPALYNSNKSIVLKQKLWEEVGCSMTENWSELTPAKQKYVLSGIKNRWRSLRRYFERRIIKNDLPYLYKKEMSFLVPVINLKNKKEHNTNTTKNDEESNTSTPNNDETLLLQCNSISETPNNSKIDHSEASSVGSIQVMEDFPNFRIFSEETTKKAEKLHKKEKKLAKFEKVLIKKILESRKKDEEIDDDEMFLLSLLPDFKKFSQLDKLDLKTEILRILNRTKEDGSEYHSD